MAGRVQASVIGKATEHTDNKIFKIFIGNGETKHHFFSRDIFVKRNGHCWMRTRDDLIKPVSPLPFPPPQTPLDLSVNLKQINHAWYVQIIL